MVAAFIKYGALLDRVKPAVFRHVIILCFAIVMSQTGMAYANPTGGSVSSGNATIVTSGPTVTINQSTNRATIDWQTFNIATGETTTFNVPTAHSMTLNRIGGQDPSQIFGTLSSNGKIYLVNPNGFIFGKDSVVNVAGILATTADIKDKDFMKGRMNFNAPGKADAAIVLNGTISAAEAGLAGFVAPTVINNGIISAKLGRVNLASGDTLTMDMYGDNLVNVAVTNETAQHLASNNGLVIADGGTIAMTAAVGKSIVNGVVSNSGILQAASVGKKNGKIVLYAEGSNAVAGNKAADKAKKSGQSGVIVSGTLDVTGTNAGEKGGSIDLLGDVVAVGGGATLMASGMTGGGNIKIGGDYLGTGTTPTATDVLVDSDVNIFNDALDNGDGGKTTIWSDGNTYFYGSVYGRGGVNGGNGGFVETSGHQYLDAQGYVDLTAPEGEKGLYFLDPANITVYGNVDPAYVSTDGSISLASSLKLWIDASDTSKVQLTYNTMSTTASGALGATTITVGSVTGLTVGARIRLGSAGSVTTADTLGADTYTIASISGTTVTLTSALTAAYTGSAVYQGYISAIYDKSGRGNTATQTTASLMPVWISNGVNGLGVASFDGSNDQLVMPGSDFAFTGTQNFSVVASATSQGGDTVTSPLIGNRDPNSNFSWMIRGLTYNLHLHGTAQYLTGKTFTVNDPNIVSTTVSGTSSLTSNVYIGGGLVQTTTGWTYYGTPGTQLYMGTMNDGTSKYKYQDMTIYNTALSTDARNLMEQYQSAKWNIALTPPGTGSTEAAKATAADGYSVFTTRYLERLSQTANVSLQATNNITLDLKGDTLNLSTAGRSLSLTAGNSINSLSSGSITTNSGNISMTATAGTLDVSNVSLNAGANGSVSLTSGGAMTLGNTTGKTVTAQTTGSTSDVTIASGKTVTATGTGTPLTVVSGRNFVNNAGSAALSAANGRWLVYSANPANDTLGGLTSGFRRFSCTYGGSCPALGTGNGFLYKYTPVLTATPDTLSNLTYGALAPGLSNYAYSLTGYLGSDATADTVTGSLNGSTAYTQYSPVGTYNINYVSGSLASAMGYGFTYGNKATAIIVDPKALIITANSGTKTYGDLITYAGTEYGTSGLVGTDSVTGVTVSSSGAAATANASTTPYAVTASNATGSGLSNYTVSYVNGQLTVNKAALSITAGNTTKTYGDVTNFAGTEFSTSGLKNTDSVSSVTLASAGAAATANASTTPYDITASSATGSGLSNYTITYHNGQLTVGKADLTITANNATKTYGDVTNFAGTEFGTSGLKNTDSVSSVTLASAGAAATANASTTAYGITASSATGSGLSNYNISYANGGLTVNKADLTITANNGTKTYGDTRTFAGTEFGTSGLKNTDSVSSVTLASAGAAATANASTTPYDITASSATGTGLSNYNISYANGGLTVGKADLTITANNGTKTYGDTRTFAGTEFDTSGLKNTDSVSSVTLASAGAAATANASTTAYGITASNATGSGLSNYNISYANGGLTVGKADLTITADNATKTYGDTRTFAGTEFGTSGLKNTDSVSSVTLASAGAAATANASTTAYAITANNATGSGLSNYNISYANGGLTVGKADLTVKANDASKDFGSNYLFNGTEFSITGLRNSDSVSSVTLGSAGAGVTAPLGAYGITASNASGTGLSNYNISYASGTLNVNGSQLSQALDNTANIIYHPVSTTGGNHNDYMLIQYTQPLAEILGLPQDQWIVYTGNNH
ncbi:MAG: MBG domain-containing protein [Micavibrio sp.]|nr:MBG domain-containing protein [Micavibrio sp.]